MTFPQHWQATIERYGTTPEQACAWAIWIKLSTATKPDAIRDSTDYQTGRSGAKITSRPRHREVSHPLEPF
jgi:hypothetical protein